MAENGPRREMWKCEMRNGGNGGNEIACCVWYGAVVRVEYQSREILVFQKLISREIIILGSKLPRDP
jgi:hypothetical protein